MIKWGVGEGEGVALFSLALCFYFWDGPWSPRWPGTLNPPSYLSLKRGYRPCDIRWQCVGGQADFILIHLFISAFYFEVTIGWHEVAGWYLEISGPRYPPDCTVQCETGSLPWYAMLCASVGLQGNTESSSLQAGWGVGHHDDPPLPAPHPYLRANTCLSSTSSILSFWKCQ